MSFNFVSTYNFKLSFDDIPLSDDYQTYLNLLVTKVRMSYVRKQLECWLAIPDVGPIHDISKWFINHPIDLTLTELSRQGETLRIIILKNCKLSDHEVLYDYTKSDIALNYLVWGFSEAQEL